MPLIDVDVDEEVQQRRREQYEKKYEDGEEQRIEMRLLPNNETMSIPLN
jgi:hypothetical protein